MTLGMNGAITGLLLIYTDGGRASSPPPELIDFVNGNTIGFVEPDPDLADRHDHRHDPAQLERRSVASSTPSARTRRPRYLAGVNVRRVLVVPYVISAIGGALTGVLLLGFLGQAFVNIGDEYLFSSAVAVAVGGASILGGSGHYIGTVAGAIILTLIAALCQLLSLGTAALQISYGLILLVTVFIASLRVSRR